MFLSNGLCLELENDMNVLWHQDIGEGALTWLINTYRSMLPLLGGSITFQDAVHLPRLEWFIRELARLEPVRLQETETFAQSTAHLDNYKQKYYQV